MGTAINGLTENKKEKIMRYQFFLKSSHLSLPEAKGPIQMVTLQDSRSVLDQLKESLEKNAVMDSADYLTVADGDGYITSSVNLCFPLVRLLNSEVNNAVQSFIQQDQKPSKEKYMLEFWVFQATKALHKPLIKHDVLNQFVEKFESNKFFPPIKDLFNFLNSKTADYQPTNDDIDKFIGKPATPAPDAKQEGEPAQRSANSSSNWKYICCCLWNSKPAKPVNISGSGSHYTKMVDDPSNRPGCC